MISFYKKTLDDFYPSYNGSLVEIYIGISNPILETYCISVSGKDDYSLSKVFNTKDKAIDLLISKILPMEYISIDYLTSLGFN